MRVAAGWIALVVAVLVYSVDPVAAGVGDEKGEANVDPSEIEASLTVGGASTKINITSDPWRECYVERVPYGHLVGDFNIPDLNEIELEADYALVDCRNGLDYDFFLYWPAGDPVPAIVTEVLGRSALARAGIVPAVVNASPDGINVPFLTQLPTWFWVPESAWRSVSATASIPELGLSITVSVSPESTTWDPGDGSPLFTCAAPTPYFEGGASDCEHVYISTNEGSPITVTAVTNYDVAVSCTPTVLCANLVPIDGLSVTHSIGATVQQIRGVITG